MLVNQSYREDLRQAFEVRIRKNARYSLRAFARDLGVSPSRISEVLNNKRGLSPVKARQIADRLGFSPREKDVFVTKVEMIHSRSMAKRETARQRMEDYFRSSTERIELDTFESISGWYHMAILELTEMKDFNSNPEWVAKRLNISVIEAKGAMDRMLRMGLLTIKDGRIVANDSFSATPNDVPSKALKEFHESMIDKAQKALYSQNIYKREFASTVVAIDRSDIPRAKQLLRDFRREFGKLMDQARYKDAVYCLGTQFFQVDEPMEAIS